MIDLQAVVSLDTGEKIEHIYIYEGDDVELLAEYFCERHNIRQEGKIFIVKEIQKQLYNTPITKRRHISTLSMTSHKSQVLIQKLYRNKTEDDVYLYLYKEGQNQKKRKQSAILEHEEQQKSQNTYKPLINRISREIMKQKPHSNEPLFKKLYKQKRIVENPPKKITRSKEQQMEHVTRLHREFSENQQKLQKKRMQQVPQELFQPIINKNTHLFRKVSRRVDKQDKKLKEQIDKGLISLKRELSKSPVRNQIQQVKRLFDQLDSDKDGLISIQFINLNIDEKMLQKIKPILVYLESRNEEINIDYFNELLQLQHIKLL